MANVTLLTHTEHPERLVAAAARLCYSPVGVEELMAGLDDEKAGKFVEMLAGLGHESPIEHCTFTFALEGVSRSLLAQITRHRIASYSVRSQRYVEESGFSYVIPPEIEAVPQAKECFLQAMQASEAQYRELAGILTEEHTKARVAAGEDPQKARKNAEKQALEDARFVLPNACDTSMIVTMNARSLLNFFSQRCCRRAQWEIRGVADEMLQLAREAAPVLFSKAGPRCLRGACPEGKMSCGKMDEVRKHYGGSGSLKWEGI